MPIRAQLPDGRVIEAPDDTTPDELDALVNQEAGSQEEPSLLQRIKTAAYETSPLPLFEKENLPGTLAALGAAGAGAATGGLALPVIAAAGGGMIGKAIGAGREGRGIAEAAPNVVTSGALQGGLTAISGLVPMAAIGAGKSLYRSALKPTQAIADKARGGADQLVKTGLEEGATVSRGGLQKIERAIQSSDDDITAMIAGSPRMVDPKKVLRELRPTVKEFSDQVNPGADLRAIGAEGRAFAERSLPGFIPVQQAQSMKQGTYRRLAKDFGKLSSPSAEAQKALARGLKNEIVEAVPEVGPINERMGRLIDLRRALDRTRMGNRDPIGLTDVIAAGTNPGMLAATLAMKPAAQSMLGRASYQTGKVINPDALAAAVRALMASLSKEDSK